MLGRNKRVQARNEEFKKKEQKRQKLGYKSHNLKRRRQNKSQG